MRDFELDIYYALKKLGARPELSGYRYIMYAMEVMLNKGDDCIMPVTKELYPLIAKKFDTESHRVERCIRHCIQDICDHTSLDTLNEVLGECHNPKLELKYTNSNFLGLLYNYLRYEVIKENK